jgi:hypothetical protein
MNALNLADGRTGRCNELKSNGVRTKKSGKFPCRIDAG